MTQPSKNQVPLHFTIVLLALPAGPAFAQDSKQVYGKITDRLTKQPVPYASVVLKHQLTGIVSNTDGEFSLRLGLDPDDTLVVNAFGYRKTMLPVRSLASPLEIMLNQQAAEIEEVTVVPHPPEYYVRQAVRRFKSNYPVTPFETEAYYREMVKENGDFIRCDEAVFRTYCKNYLDSSANHDQLLLYRRADDIRDIAFMSEDRKTRKARRQGKEIPKDTSAKKKSNVALDSFEGPDDILKSSKPGGEWHFLDTTRMRSFRYAFDGHTYFNDREVMIIAYTSRGKVEHMRDRGRIYIDRENLAIVRIQSAGEIVIPVALRPLLFAAGFGITNPIFNRDMEFQPAAGRWYPSRILYDISLELTKRYIFAPNEHSRFDVNQVFAVNRLEVEKPEPVEKSKHFNPSKPIGEQVHNDRSLTWDQVNVVRPSAGS